MKPQIPTKMNPPMHPPSISTFISSHPSLHLLSTQCTSMHHLRILHSHLLRTGLAAHPIAASRLLSFTASADLTYATHLFSRTPNPTPFMYNTLIRALSRSPHPHLALSLFLRMLRSSAQPQTLTFPSLFLACANLGIAGYTIGSQLHSMVVKLGLNTDIYIRNTLISMYAATARPHSALKLFHRCTTFDIVATNTVILCMARNGLVEKARSLFDEMPERNVVTWSAMISGYVRNGMNSEALALFQKMQEGGVEPNVNVMSSLLSACAGVGAIEQGEWIHSYIERNKIEMNPILTTALIDMYCKCGNVDKACQVFGGSSNRGLSSWNSMISGLAVHGRGEEAVELFSRLRGSGLRPDGVSFLGVLTACSHSGMVREVEYYLELMRNVYKIEPGIEHYGCMVDALGRAGRLKEAEELIGAMRVEPDAAIWGSLLSACKIHGDVEIGERAGMRVLDLDPLDSGGYVMLANCYADIGEHRDAVGARLTMKERRVRKVPGSSKIEVNGVAHEFVAAGVLHSRREEIYKILDCLNLMMRGSMLTLETGILDEPLSTTL